MFIVLPCGGGKFTPDVQIGWTNRFLTFTSVVWLFGRLAFNRRLAGSQTLQANSVTAVSKHKRLRLAVIE